MNFANIGNWMVHLHSQLQQSIKKIVGLDMKNLGDGYLELLIQRLLGFVFGST